MGILREADQRLRRYLPAREKETFIERIVEENWGARPLIQSDPFVLISNDPWDAQLVSQQC